MKLTPLLFLFVLVQSYCFSQTEQSGLKDPNPANRTDEYEMIILDGDTLLRNNVTNELYNKGFRKVRDEYGNKVFRTDWMNTDWNTNEFNPYESTDVEWPLLINFSNDQFTVPVEGVVTSRYGWRKGRAHRGIDLDLVTGDNVRVAMDGKVRFAQYYGGYGNCIVVRHNNGLETVYAHLSKIIVQPNTYVYSGQVIGKGGNTGRSYGSHLHFEVRYKNNAINPEYIFTFEDQYGINAHQLYVDERWADPRKHRSYKKSIISVRSEPMFAQQPSTMAKPTQQASQSLSKPSNDGLTKQTPAQSSGLSKAKTSTHIIQSGDTLAKIASRYGTTVNTLCELNGISKSSILRVGAELRVN